MQSYRIGLELQPLIRVDDFMEGAAQLKAMAIEADNFAKADSFYPGVRMPIHPDYTVGTLKHLQQPITDLFELDLRKIKQAVSKFSIVTLSPTELGVLQRIPHFDAASKNSLAMIHYLCNSATEGTAFYRHQQSGFEFVDQGRYDNYMRCINHQFSSPERYPKGYICGNSNEYRLIESFSAKFNRLLVYRGSSLHSGMISSDYNFDPSPATGRLTITTFIEFH